MRKGLKVSLLLAFLLLVGFACWWYFGDVGLDYQSCTVHLNQSYELSIDENNPDFVNEPVKFVAGLDGTHTLEYVAGRGHSRSTSAHGYIDRIVVEFREESVIPGGHYRIIRADRVGYRGYDFNRYRIRSLDDVWIKISSYGDCLYVEGAVKITHFDEGKFNEDRFEVICIPPMQVKRTH